MGWLGSGAPVEPAAYPLMMTIRGFHEVGGVIGDIDDTNSTLMHGLHHSCILPVFPG